MKSHHLEYRDRSCGEYKISLKISADYLTDYYQALVKAKDKLEREIRHTKEDILDLKAVMRSIHEE